MPCRATCRSAVEVAGHAGGGRRWVSRRRLCASVRAAPACQPPPLISSARGKPSRVRRPVGSACRSSVPRGGRLGRSAARSGSIRGPWQVARRLSSASGRARRCRPATCRATRRGVMARRSWSRAGGSLASVGCRGCRRAAATCRQRSKRASRRSAAARGSWHSAPQIGAASAAASSLSLASRQSASWRPAAWILMLFEASLGARDRLRSAPAPRLRRPAQALAMHPPGRAAPRARDEDARCAAGLLAAHVAPSTPPPGLALHAGHGRCCQPRGGVQGSRVAGRLRRLGAALAAGVRLSPAAWAALGQPQSPVAPRVRL